VLVVKDEPARMVLTHAAALEQGDAARPCLQRFTDQGLKVTAAFSDASPSCTAALTAVSPQARLQADHCQTVQTVWGHRKQALFSSRRQGKASGAAQQEAAGRAWAKQVWP
jgi:hypothetical protein